MKAYMIQTFSIKRYHLIFILLPLILVSLFILKTIVFAAGNHILINTQPSGTNSVDFVLSQQPILSVKDSNNNPVQGVTVTAITSGAGDLNGNLAEVTDSNGLAIFTDLSYSGTDSFQIIFGSSAGKATSNSIKLSPGAASATKSSISVSPSSVTADGQSIATITINCEDKYSNVIPGANVAVSTSGSNNTLSQSDLADNPGITTVNLASTKAESKTISVTVNSVFIGSSHPINFTPGKIAKLSISADSPVDTNHTSQITITGKDKFDNIVTNDSETQVALSVDNGGSLDSALVTLSKGIAIASLSKKTSGTVNLIASDGNINATSRIVFNSADSIAPVVSSQYPLGGAENISTNAVPYINFSKIMDATTITDDNVQLRKLSDDSLVPSVISIANGVKQVRLQPNSNLDFNTKYYLYVSTGVSDSAGNNLESSYTGGPFTTALNSGTSSSSQGQNNDRVNQSTNAITSPDAGTTSIDSSTELSSANSNNTSTGTIATNQPHDNTITTKSGGSTENLLDYAPAGLLGVFKNFDLNELKNWFIQNFIWIISFVIVATLVYIFWKWYF